MDEAMHQEEVRALAICVFSNEGSILVAELYDATKDELFYRPLGGSIEFGEYSRQTVVREIQEEIGEETTDLLYLGTIENIFTYKGHPGHEIALVYDGAFTDTSVYQRASVEGHEDDGIFFKAVWKPLDDFRPEQPPLYPDGLLELLTRPAGH